MFPRIPIRRRLHILANPRTFISIQSILQVEGKKSGSKVIRKISSSVNVASNTTISVKNSKKVKAKGYHFADE